jgi:hypothetical protein
MFSTTKKRVRMPTSATTGSRTAAPTPSPSSAANVTYRTPPSMNTARSAADRASATPRKVQPDEQYGHGQQARRRADEPAGRGVDQTLGGHYASSARGMASRVGSGCRAGNADATGR